MADISLTPYIVNGLRPHADLPKNSPYMTKMQNLMACERRGKPLPIPTWPAGFPSVSENFPLAETFVNEDVALAVVDNAFHTLNRTALTSSAITLYEATDIAETDTVNGNGLWQFAAFRDSWFATNGTSLVYKATSTADNKVAVHHTSFVCQAVCNWNNRLVLGGLSGSRLASSSFGRFFQKWLARNKRNVVTSEDDAVGTDWLLLGPPVGGDSAIPNAMILALLGIPSDSSYTSIFEPLVFTWAELGLLDLLPCRHTGAIQNAKVQDGDLIVYGTEGVSRVRETEAGPMEQQVSPIGVWGRGAVCGNESEVLSLGADGNAYMAGQGAMRYARDGVYSPEQVGAGFYRLGWAEYINTVIDGTKNFTLITYDPTEQRYWITGGPGKSFLLSKTGLSWSRNVSPSTVLRLPGSTALLGAATVVAAGATGAARVELETMVFDGGRRDPFIVTEVDLTTTDTAATESERWTAVPIARLQKSTAFTTFPEVLADIRGRASLEMLGLEQAVALRNDNYTTVDLDGGIIFIADPGKTPSMRKWITALS